MNHQLLVENSRDKVIVCKYNIQAKICINTKTNINFTVTPSVQNQLPHDNIGTVLPYELDIGGFYLAIGDKFKVKFPNDTITNFVPLIQENHSTVISFPI